VEISRHCAYCPASHVCEDRHSYNGPECVNFHIDMEKKFTSTNTGSLKLPTLAECQMAFQSLPRNNGFSIASEKLAIEFVYDFICRQLRAGA